MGLFDEQIRWKIAELRVFFYRTSRINIPGTKYEDSFLPKSVLGVVIVRLSLTLLLSFYFFMATDQFFCLLKNGGG